MDHHHHAKIREELNRSPRAKLYKPAKNQSLGTGSQPIRSLAGDAPPRFHFPRPSFKQHEGTEEHQN